MIVDLFLVYQFVKRLATPFKDWDAYKLGIIDENGKILKKSRDLTTQDEKKAWGKFDVMISKLKGLLEKIPGGSSRIASYAAALWLLKEGKDEENVMLTEEKLQDYIDYVEENLDIDEDAPTMSAGNGAIAGIGVGPDGEPGFRKSAMDKYKKKNKKLKKFKEMMK